MPRGHDRNGGPVASPRVRAAQPRSRTGTSCQPKAMNDGT